MRVLIISDIHANVVALEAVLNEAKAYEAVWCLGDLVGYGPNPNECVERIRALPNLLCLVGNHDKAVLGEIPINTFNADARQSIAWTQHMMTADNIEYLRGLPEMLIHADFTLAHGSPRQPVWEYILDQFIAHENFAYFSTRYCLVGHTHMPVIYEQTGTNGAVQEDVPDYRRPRPLNGARYIINPGSVGQPRDSNPDAAYANLDTDTAMWRHHRVAYNIAETQTRMRAAQFPDRLVARLAYGW